MCNANLHQRICIQLHHHLLHLSSTRGEVKMPKKVERRGRKDYEFIDAKEPLTIHVTQRDIDKAVPGSARQCVMARSVHREYGCFNIELHRTVAYVWWTAGSAATRYQITQSSRDVLVAFDASGRMKPVTV